MNLNPIVRWVLIGFGALVLIAVGIWFFFLRSSAPAQTNNPADNFGVSADTGGTTNNTADTNTTQPINTQGQTSQTKIFQITRSPVVGATLIQTLRPTTTLARFIRQEDGHVFDAPLDVPGAVPRVISNVTIPGGQRAVWVEGGNAAVMQYVDGNTVKSVYLGFTASSTASSTLPTRIQFLPDAIVDIAASPDGKNVAYLLKTSSGVDGYTAKADGTGNKKVFSLPLSQMLISWPSPNTLLAQTKSAAGVPGIVFSVDVKSGAVTPLIYSQGITAMADATFSNIIYQTVQSGASVALSYAHAVKSGADTPLSFNPIPEKCLWSNSNPQLIYCAVATVSIPANYLDLWHQGVSGAADAVISINIATDKVTLKGAPGNDGGVQSDILEMALSPNERYLSFTNKSSRTLWGIRLTQ